MRSDLVCPEDKAAPPKILRALGHGNYRRFFVGQGVSLLGTWIQQTALVWLVLRLTDNAFLVGLNNFASNIPWLFLVPVAGVLLDRWDLLRVVKITQALAMVQAFVLAMLVLGDAAEIVPVLFLSFSLGCVNSFDLPARQALLPGLLDRREDLSNAIALNSSLFNAARLVGPALAGLLAGLGEKGEGLCFLLNALSFLAVLMSLFAIRIRRAPPARTSSPAIWSGLTEGLNFVRGHAPIRAVLVAVAILGFTGMPYTILVPVFARHVLEGDALTYGLLLTASGLGALGGAVYLASRPNIRGCASRIVVAGVTAAGSMAMFAFSKSFEVSMLLMLITGLSIMLIAVSCNTLVQSLVPDDKRGRVMSLYSVAFMGLTPFGALIGGGIASYWGPTTAMLACAAGCLAGALLFLPRLGLVRAAIRAHIAELKQPPPETWPSEPVAPE